MGAELLAALDAMRWHTGYVVTGYGVRIGVRVNRAALARQLQQRVTPGTRIAANPSGGPVSRIVSFVDGGSRSSADTPRYNVHANGGLVSRADDVTIIHDAYDTQLRVAFAEFSTRKLFIHAGVVGWRGRAIVIPGRSLAGKTTLTAALVRAGAICWPAT